MITKAMILAAGYGTRLKPLTDTVPKALIPHKSKPMLENVIVKLKAAGINEVTVNTHYFADKIKEYFDNNNYGLKINLTYEKEILGTGGGIKNASGYLKDSGDFLVHNVDVDSDIDLSKLSEFHFKHSPLAALAVKKRETSRPLLIDENNNLMGRMSKGKEYFSKQANSINQISFCGVYILSARVFELFPAEANFDIVLFLLDMVKAGEKILCYDIGDTHWKDLGRYEDFNN